MMATLCAIFSVCGGVFYAEAYFLVDRNLFLFHTHATLNGEQRGGGRDRSRQMVHDQSVQCEYID